MFDRTFPLRPVLACLAAVLLCGGFALTLEAQQANKVQLNNRDDTETPFRLKHLERFNKLKEGAAVDPASPGDKELLDLAGKFFIYRLTWTGYDRLETQLKDLQKDFNELMDNKVTKSGANKEFMQLLAHEFVVRFTKVLALDYKYNTAAVTNAALMLPVLARCKQDEVHDFLLKTAKPGAILEIKDEKIKTPVHPFVRMCAVKALGEFNNPEGLQLSNPNKKKNDLARLDAIWQFIQLPYPPEGKGPEYDAALTFVRREGVKALTPIRAPALDISKNPVEGPVAYYLMYIASGGPVKDGPPFTIAEKMEAAIALSLLNTAGTPQYNNELAVHVVGNALVEFATAYRDDFAYFTVKVKDAPKRQPLLPWKSYAERWEDGLKKMGDGLKGLPIDKLLDEVRGNVKDMLNEVKGLKKTEPPQVLQQFLTTNRPAVAEVFIGNKQFVLPLGEK